MREDLEQEITRLEQRLGGAAASELATVRSSLGSGDGKLRLANVRIGFPCKERWEDMVGDDRVRACAGCERPVFNLSEMTRAEAEAVLATRGLTPCIRMYLRPDGTVMTADCPKSERPPSRKLAVVASSLAVAGSATPVMADDAPVDEDPCETSSKTPTDAAADPAAFDPTFVQPLTVQPITVVMGGISAEPYEYEPAPRPLVEWSVWGRLGSGMTSPRSDLVARRATSESPMVESDSMAELAALADITFGVARRGTVRLGAFAEVRTSSDPVAGGELVVYGLPPDSLEHRIYGGGSLVLRAGGSASVMTGAIGFGYVGARPRSRPWVSWARHAVGGRVVVSMNRSLDDPRDWSALVGLEVEPLGLVHGLVDVIRGR